MKSIRTSLCFGSPISSTALNIKNDIYKSIIRYSHKKTRVSSSHKNPTFLVRKVKKKYVKHLSTHSIGRKQDSGDAPKDWHGFTKNIINTNLPKNESALETSYNSLAPTYMFNNFSLPTFSHLENSFNLFNLKEEKNAPCINDLNTVLNKNIDMNDMIILAQNNDITPYRNRLYNLINGKKELENETFKNDVLKSSVRREQAIQEEFFDAEDEILGSTPSNIIWRNDSIPASIKGDFTPPTDNVTMTLVPANRPKRVVTQVTSSFLDQSKIQEENIALIPPNVLNSDPYELPEINCSEAKDYEDELRKIPLEQGSSTDPSSILNILNSIDKSAVIIQKDIYITNRILDQLKKKDEEKDKKIEAKELNLELNLESEFFKEEDSSVPEETIFMLKNNGQIVEDSFKMSNFRPNNTISRPNMIQSRQSHDSSKKPSDSKLNVDMATKTIITSTNKESGSEISVVEVQKFTDKRLPFPFSTETVLQVFGSKDKLHDALSVVEQSKAKLAVLNNTEPSKKGIESFQNMLTSLKTNKKDTIPLIIPVDPLNDKHTPQPSPESLMRQAKHAELVKLAQTITANNKAMRITFTNKPKRIVIRKNQNRVKKNTNPPERKPFKESIEKVKIIGPNQIDLILGLSSKDSVAKRKSAYFQPLKKTQNMIKSPEVKKQVVKKPKKNNVPKPVMEIKPLMTNIGKKEIKVKKDDEDDGLSLRDRSILKDILDGKYKFHTFNHKTTKDPPKRRSSTGGAGKGPDEPTDDSQISKKMIEQMKKDSCENPIFPNRDTMKDCKEKEIKKNVTEKKLEKAKVNFTSEKKEEPKVTIIEHYGPPKPKEEKPIKESKITTIEHYPTEPVKVKAAPKAEIKPEVIKPEKIKAENIKTESIKTEKIKTEKIKPVIASDPQKKDMGNVKISVVIPQGQKRTPIKSPGKEASSDKPLEKNAKYPRVFYVTKKEEKKVKDLKQVAFDSVAHQPIHQPITVHPIPESIRHPVPKLTDPPKQSIKPEVAKPKPVQDHISPKIEQLKKPELSQPKIQEPITPKLVQPQPIKKPELAQPKPEEKPKLVQTHQPKHDHVSPKLVQPQTIKKPEEKPVQTLQPIKHDQASPKLVQPQTIKKPEEKPVQTLHPIKHDHISPKVVEPQTIKKPDLVQSKAVQSPIKQDPVVSPKLQTQSQNFPKPEQPVQNIQPIKQDPVVSPKLVQSQTVQKIQSKPVQAPQPIKQDPVVSPKIFQSQTIEKPELQPKPVQSQTLPKPELQTKPIIKQDPVSPKIVQSHTIQSPIKHPDPVVSPKSESQPIKTPEVVQAKPVEKPIEDQKPTQVQFAAVQQVVKPQTQEHVEVKPQTKKHPVLQDMNQGTVKQVEVKRPSTSPNEPKSHHVQAAVITKTIPSTTLKAQSQSNIQGIQKEQTEAIKNRVLEKMNFKNNQTVAETPPTQISEFLFNFDKFGKETTPILDTSLCRECAVPEHKLLDYPMINLAKDGRHDPVKHGIISIEINNNVMLKKQLKGIPSVTTVLNSTMADSSKAALSRWRTTMVQQLGEAGFRDFYKEQLKKGSDFHGSVHQYLKTYSVLGKADDSTNLTFKSVQDVLKNIKEVSVLESQVVHPQLGYRGVVDCVAKYKGVPVIIEWKRSDKPKPTVRHTFDAPLQLSAYIGALNFDKSYDVKIQGAVVVVAYSDGTQADVFSLSLDECSTYWKQWLARLKSYISTNQGFPLSSL